MGELAAFDEANCVRLSQEQVGRRLIGNPTCDDKLYIRRAPLPKKIEKCGVAEISCHLMSPDVPSQLPLVDRATVLATADHGEILFADLGSDRLGVIIEDSPPQV